MIYYKKYKLLTIAEIWYNEKEEYNHKIDLIKYNYIKNPHPNAIQKKTAATPLIDLTMDEDEIFNRIRKSAKYHIKRASDRDEIVTETFFSIGECNNNKISQYIEYFNQYARTKNKKLLDKREFYPYLQYKTFCIRWAKDNENKILAMHSYVVSDNRARLYQSCSHFRESNDTAITNKIARANRLLHWDDILFFKEIGLSLYDLGGWHLGSDKERLAINYFKEAFGGFINTEYSYIVPLTLRGRTATFLRGILKH
jgi:hypothetical protein